VTAASVRVVLCTAPSAGDGDKPGAAALAQQLVQERLCACANVVPAVQSFFWWQGRVDTATESLLILKTTAETAAALRARILELHPYRLPEVLELTPTGGHDAYLRWIVDAVRG
jgi:periplasmic divalent cation tolerance protein